MILLRSGDYSSFELHYKSLSCEWLVVEIDLEPFYKITWLTQVL